MLITKIKVQQRSKIVNIKVKKVCFQQFFEMAVLEMLWRFAGRLYTQNYQLQNVVTADENGERQSTSPTTSADTFSDCSFCRRMSTSE